MLKPTMYRSKFEKKFADMLKDNFVRFKYEDTRLKYTIPARRATYTPDFKVMQDGKPVFFETKGRWTSQDRKKHLLLTKDPTCPRIILVFMNPNVKIYKGSKTTYAEWADKHNLEWCKLDDALQQLTEQRKNEYK